MGILDQIFAGKPEYQECIPAQQKMAELTARYRNYYDGEHDAEMTPQMRKLLRVKLGGAFNDNYMSVVVDTMTDRANLDTVDAENDTASDWSQEVLEDNRIDALQGDVHEAAIRDGNTFVMVSWDNENNKVKLTHELAYDGTSGMLAFYSSRDVATMDMAVKVWQIVGKKTRINCYYPDRVEKYVADESGGLTRFEDPGGAWAFRDGTPLGVPVIHFRNRGRHNYGVSELKSAIPLQDSLNRLMHSIVMTAELTGFRMLFAKGFDPGSDITPGVVIVAGPNGLTKDDVADLTVIPPGEIGQLLSTAQWTTNEIGKITRTPAPEFGGNDNASGEALKQRDIGLIGKVKRFTVRAGNAWEAVMSMAHAVQTAYGTTMPPAYKRFYARFQDAEIRNDTVTIDNALKIKDLIGDRETLRAMAAIYGWDEAKIDQILAEKKETSVTNFADALNKSQGAYLPFGGGANGQRPTAIEANIRRA